MSLGYVSRAGEEQKIAWIGGSVHHVVLDAAATEGRLAAFRSVMIGGAAAPVHVHDNEDETVFVIRGEGVFWAGADRWSLTSGDTAFLPRGLPHTYRFTSETVELITICNPAGMEEFFRAAGWDLSVPPPEGWAVDMAAMAAAADAAGQRVLGPPLEVDAPMPEQFRQGKR